MYNKVFITASLSTRSPGMPIFQGQPLQVEHLDSCGKKVNSVSDCKTVCNFAPFQAKTSVVEKVLSECEYEERDWGEV